MEQGMVNKKKSSIIPVEFNLGLPLSSRNSVVYNFLFKVMLWRGLTAKTEGSLLLGLALPSFGIY
jgi:hypothetical protein